MIKLYHMYVYFVKHFLINSYNILERSDNMNFYSPYFGYAPYNTMSTSNGLIHSLINGVKSTNWSSILSNIQKTLGIVNQTIPMVRQIPPIVKNAKTMFQVMNEFKKQDSNLNKSNKKNKMKIENVNSQNIYEQKDEINKYKVSNYNNPVFFL